MPDGVVNGGELIVIEFDVSTETTVWPLNPTPTTVMPASIPTVFERIRVVFSLPFGL